MIRFAIRDLIWLTVVAALCVAWWIDRGRLAVPLADYRRLKAAEASQDDYLRSEEGVLLMKMFRGEIPAEDVESSVEQDHSETRPIPGNNDYQLPLTYPLHYDGKSDS
jgi:hypothetical protein